MFEFFKRKKPAAPSCDGSNIPPLFFKDGPAAIEYACKFMECSLHEGRSLPAVVLDSRELFGTPTAVKTQNDGNQIAMLRVASDDGGFLVTATTAGPLGPKLQPGQLVAWKAMNHMPDIAKTMKDKRFGCVGLIIGTLKPEHRNGSWVGDEMFSA
jgi:hypothetical protein